jgi:hypothetical protein
VRPRAALRDCRQHGVERPRDLPVTLIDCALVDQRGVQGAGDLPVAVVCGVLVDERGGGGGASQPRMSSLMVAPVAAVRVAVVWRNSCGRTDVHRMHNTGDTTAMSPHIYGADITRIGSSARRYYD